MPASETIKRLLRASHLYWPLLDARSALQETLWRGRVRRWLGAQRRRKTRIHSSIEFTGNRPSLGDLQIGPDCYFERNVTIWFTYDKEARPRLTLESDVYLGHNTYLGVFEPIAIGRDVMIGAFSYLISGDHTFERRDIPMTMQPYRGGAIVIEDDVWIGAHVVILAGVTIGRGAVVGACSLVNKDIPPYEIWGGAPARFLKKRPD